MPESSWANTSNHTLKINITKPATTESPRLESPLEKCIPQLDTWKAEASEERTHCCMETVASYLETRVLAVLSTSRRSCLTFKCCLKIENCSPFAKLFYTEIEPVGKRDHLAGLSHSDSPDIRKVQIKWHETVASPVKVTCSLRALLMSAIQRNRREKEKDFLKTPGTRLQGKSATLEVTSKRAEALNDLLLIMLRPGFWAQVSRPEEGSFRLFH